MHHKECEIPFWKEPSVLFQHFSLQYKPVCEHSVWNFVTRIVILSVCVGMIASAVAGASAVVVAALFGAITAYAIVMTTPVPEPEHSRHHSPHFKTIPSDKYHDLPYTAVVDPAGVMSPIKEHFINGTDTMGSVQPVADPIGMAEVDAASYSASSSLPDFTPPTSRNLFMNVLVDEIKYNPDRPEAAPVGQPTVKQTLDDFFRIQWFSDPTDVFGKNQNQRQYITQPSTTVPNDQGSFANWLYKIPGKTCKEGGRESCLAGTDGGPMPWANQFS